MPADGPIPECPWPDGIGRVLYPHPNVRDACYECMDGVAVSYHLPNAVWNTDVNGWDIWANAYRRTILTGMYSSSAMSDTLYSNVTRIGTGMYRFRAFGGAVGSSNPSMLQDITFNYTLGGNNVITEGWVTVNPMGRVDINVPRGNQSVGGLSVSVTFEEI